MHEAILQFVNQLSFNPKIENGPAEYHGGEIIVAGMGGSNLSSGLLTYHDPILPVYIHRTYGLPPFDLDTLKNSLLIASSYSGNTEETIDFINSALSKGLRPVVVTSGGKLLALARKEHLPYVELPADIIQPRMALGVSLKALAFLTNQNELLEELERLSRGLDPVAYEREGKQLAENLQDFVPLIYTSSQNESIAYNWKIKINETGKSPAFFNLFPELNHNELAGFSGKSLPEPYKILFIEDATDHERIKTRMHVTKELLSERGIESVTTELKGKSKIERALRSILIADFTAFHLALLNDVEPSDVPAIEEFKKRIL